MKTADRHANRPNHIDVWEKCLLIIKKRLPEDSFKVWFEPILPLSLKEGLLTIQVPTEVFYEWIEEYHVSVLHQAIRHTLGPQGKLAYAIKERQGRQGGIAPAAPISLARKESFSQPSAESTAFRTVLEGMMGRYHERYIFSEFVVGEENRLLKEVALEVARGEKRDVFNPTVLYGSVGIGKTHLMQAIAQHRKTLTTNHQQVVYVCGHQFVNQFTTALRHKRMQDFTDLYMKADILLIDDIHVLKGKPQTQDLLFNVFNHLHQGGKQLVFTCDTPPTELEGMHERLISRFKWGLCLEMRLPDLGTRRKIIEKKSAREGVQLPEEVLDYLCREVQTNVRELEGIVVSLLAYAILGNQSVDLPLVQAHVSRLLRQPRSVVTVSDIRERVSNYFNVKPQDLLSKTRRRDIVMARQVAMYLTKTHTKASLSLIGEQFGKRDHSTVLHALQQVDKKRKEDQQLQESLNALGSQLLARTHQGAR